MTTFDMNNAVENALSGKIEKYAIYLRKSRADLEAEKDGFDRNGIYKCASGRNKTHKGFIWKEHKIQ